MGRVGWRPHRYNNTLEMSGLCPLIPSQDHRTEMGKQLCSQITSLLTSSKIRVGTLRQQSLYESLHPQGLTQSLLHGGCWMQQSVYTRETDIYWIHRCIRIYRIGLQWPVIKLDVEACRGSGCMLEIQTIQLKVWSSLQYPLGVWIRRLISLRQKAEESMLEATR